MADDAITPAILLEHIQAMRNSLEGRMDRMEKRLDGRIDGLGRRMDRMEGDISFMKVQIGNISDTTDRIEIIVIGKRHEERIQHLEKVVGV